MGIISSIIEKMRIKEIFGVIFIVSLLLTFMPEYLANMLKVNDIRIKYQTYISLAFIIIGAFYFF